MSVAVTGYGCVTPFGEGAASLFDAWIEGRCAIRPIRRFDTSALRSHVGGEIPDGDGDPCRGVRHLRSALDQAIGAASLPRASRVLVLVATAKGFLERGAQLESGDPACDVGTPARWIAEELGARHGLRSVVATVSTACTSGLTALAIAHASLRPGGPDAVICVGIDLLSDFVFRGFAALGAVDPAPCRPFDVARAGMSAAEAAAALVLEREDGARSRGALLRGRILGGGLANDATHPTAPDRDGKGLARAILEALAVSGVDAARLGHVHAHGTATVFNDAMEVRALHAALGREACRVPVTALKGAIGHSFGPSSLVETIASFEAARRGFVPGVTGLARPESDLDFVTAPRPLANPLFLKTGAGFGGFDAAIVGEGIPA